MWWPGGCIKPNKHKKKTFINKNKNEVDWILKSKKVSIEKWFDGWYIIGSNIKIKLFGVYKNVEFVVFNE